MATYLLRDIPKELHAKAIRKAEAEDRTLRRVLIQAMRDWVEGRWTPTRGED